MKLNQVIAIVTGTKTQTQKVVTSIYKKIQNTDLMAGISRKYKPRDEEGEALPPESKRIQLTADQAINEAVEVWAKTWDMVASQDEANSKAFADVEVSGYGVLLTDVNVLHLLYLDKQLTDVKAFVNKMPVLDPSEEWDYKDEVGAYATEAYETTRTKKVPRNHVKAVATEQHPAQVEVYMEDVIVGTWSTIKYSGAMSVAKKVAILNRIGKLQDAVKKAREQANMIDAEQIDEANSIFSYIFK